VAAAGRNIADGDGILSDWIERARATLRANDRGGYTVPTARLYPFQWNWDSAFVAMGWATFDTDRAWQEIELLLRGQWDDGLIPQIVFHAPSDDYFPGPDVWRIAHVPPTSGIPQPPVLATAARAVLAADPAGEARMAAIYPRLIANHRWWESARDPSRSGLVATLHPWETGMDNSPAWDAALARVPTETTTEIRRRDTGHVDPSMRPRGEEYQRFIHLVDLFRDCGWDPARMLAAAPLRVADIGTNAILLRAEHDLLALAGRFGTAAERAEIETRIARKHAAVHALWDAALGLFVSHDLVADAPIAVGTSAGFLPLFAHAATSSQAAALAGTLARWAERVKWLVPSTDPAHAAFEPLRYWRGPIWCVVNWMIAEGFAASRQGAVAARVRESTRGLIETAGLAEYFDPLTGRGLGGAEFSWTAAIYLMLVDEVAIA
jgi:glycogen debranching enzyme